MITARDRSTEEYRPPDFSVRSLLARSLDVLARNAAPFVPVGVLAGIPAQFARTSDTTAGSLILLVAYLVLYALCQGIVGHAAFEALRGRPVRLADSIARTLQRFVPLMIASAAVALIAALGVIVFVAPGIIALVMLIVTVPACVVERLGPVESLKRSLDLTAHYRWRIFGAAGLFALGSIAAEWISTAALHPPSTAYSVVSALGDGITNSLAAVLAATVYHDLRLAKEGTAIDGAATPFG